MQKSIERYGVGIVIGSAATIGLLYLMQAVIGNETYPLNEAPVLRAIEIVPVIEDVEPIPKDPFEKPPPPPDELPPAPPMLEDEHEGPTWGTPIQYEPEDAGAEISATRYAQDGEYLPIYKTQPKYPPHAAQRGIEGHVVLVFTVTELGRVIDPVVEQSDPAGVFDRAALNAVVQFKYRPRVVEGEAIRIDGVRHKFTFQLDD